MLTVLVDVGNTRAKWVQLGPGDEVKRGVCSADALLKHADTWPVSDMAEVLIASVLSPSFEETLEQGLRQRGFDVWFARPRASFGRLCNGYVQPEQMGVDRWLAMVGACGNAGDAFCVVDAGSALTIDLVTSSGTHIGGYIIPGTDMMRSALLAGTDRVRFETIDQGSLAPGVSTAEAVEHGILLAQAGAVQAALQQPASTDAVRVLFCGGGGRQLLELLVDWLENRRCTAALRPDLVFEGVLKQAAEERPASAAGYAHFLTTLEKSRFTD